MGDSDTRSVLLMSSLLRNLVLVAVTAENPASQRWDVGNGSRLFSAFVAISGYSALTLIQNVWRFEVVSNMLLRPPSFVISSSWSFSSTDKVDSPGLFTDGLWIHSFPVQGLLWLGSNAQTLLKAEIGDYTPSGRKKPLAQSLSKSLLMFETRQKSPCSLVAPIIPVWLWMQPLYLPTSTQLSFSPKVTDWVRWTGWICHTSKQVLRPIMCHWNVLPVVTVFLKEISGVALKNSGHLTSVYKRRHVRSASISSQSCTNRRELRACTLMWLIILITSCKTLFSSGDIFRLASISLWMTQCVDSHSEVTSLTRVMKPQSRPVMAAALSVHILTQNDQVSFPYM